MVFTGGYSLYEAKRDRHPNIHPFPSSVDRAHFAQARATCAEPADQAAIARPRLGFYGVVDERMDLDLLAALADARPDWSHRHGRAGGEDRPGRPAAAAEHRTTWAARPTTSCPPISAAGTSP